MCIFGTVSAMHLGKFIHSTAMRLSLSLFTVLFLTATLTAETRLILGNGDSLRGQVVKVEDGVVIFDSEALGVLTLPSTGVTIEETDPSKSVTQEILAAGAEKSAVDSPDPTNQTDSDVREEPVQRKPDWEKSVEFGLTMQSGRRDKMDVSGRFSANRSVRQDQYRIRARYLYGETSFEKSTDQLESSFRWRRDLNPRMFTQALTAYEYDDIKHINHDFSQGVGVGRKLYNLDTFSFSMGGGATARYRDENGDPPRWNYMVDAFQDFDYKINSVFKVTQDANILIEPEDPDNYSLRLNAALIGKITETVTMSMRYEYEYDNSLTLQNRFNQRIITSLGYLF
jgi:putative salt-induced outer membrane protein YdiY